jgi:hypothetical protein
LASSSKRSYSLSVLREVKERGLLLDQQFGFRPRHSTALQLGRLVERVNRKFDVRRLTGAVFLDVAKAFDTVWIKGLFCKLTILNFLSYLVKTLSSYLHKPKVPIVLQLSHILTS